MSGMLIAQFSYLAAILLFYKVARLIRDDHRYAMRCVIYLVLFPSSFFFFAIYAESLSLAFSLLGVFLVLGARPLYARAGLALGIASAARPVGWLLDSVLVVEFIRRRKFNLSSLVSLGVGLALSGAGIVAFVLYLYRLTGKFTAVPEATAEWGRQWQLPWITFWKSVRIAFTGNVVEGDWFLYITNWSDLFFTTLALILTAVAVWWSYKQRFNWGLSVYLVVSLLFLLTYQGLEMVPLWGMTRWVAALFPIYLVLGDLIRHRVAHWITVLASSSLLMLFTAWWVSGRWVG
jgi:Gpi18-like mannosyltransferase